MKQKYVLSRKNLPTNYPVSFMIAVYLLLRDFNIPEWLWGVLGLLAVLLIISTAVNRHYEKEVMLFDNDSKDEKHLNSGSGLKRKSDLKQHVDKLREQRIRVKNANNSDETH